MSLPSITPQEAKRLVDSGALLVDIREANEHAGEHIPGARLMPLSAFDAAHPVAETGRKVVFHCRSGARTRAHAARLARTTGSAEGFVLEGGLSAWKRAGLPTVAGHGGSPAALEPVPIAAGIVGFALGFLVSPWFFAVPAGVAAALVAARIARSPAAARRRT